MERRKLNYRFHNPNSEEETIDYILKILIKANEDKIDEMIRSQSQPE